MDNKKPRKKKTRVTSSASKKPKKRAQVKKPKRNPVRKKPTAKPRKKVIKKKKTTAQMFKEIKGYLTEAKVRRKLREELAPGRGVTRQDRVNVYNFYGRACLICGSKRSLCLDHVQALYCGGRHDPDNLQPLCYSHNSEKGLKTIDYRPQPWPY